MKARRLALSVCVAAAACTPHASLGGGDDEPASDVVEIVIEERIRVSD